MKKLIVLFAATGMALAIQGQSVLVDSLTSGSTAAYTETIILAQNADGALTFQSTPTGLQVSRTFSGGSSAQQDLLLRNDYSLQVGQTLRVSITNLATSSANADFGIAIASQVNPVPAVWTTGTVSTRSNYLAMYVKPGNSQVGSIGFNGTTQVYSSGGVTPPGGSYTSIIGLWITQVAPNVFNDGYTTTSGDVILGSGITFTGADIGNSIGFFGDVRASITSAATLYNLVIVPEPSTLALCGAGGVALLIALRRKK